MGLRSPRRDWGSYFDVTLLNRIPSLWLLKQSAARIPPCLDKMPNKNFITVLIALFLSLLPVVEAQSGSTIAVGPPLTCGITTFACPSISNGCCTIDGCCGTGCCALGYKCTNEGTSDQACCSVYDSTLCGTKASVSS
ncbi:hypothetical protein V8F20_001142 [Naviculisporaceae sp. PSN 640]